MFDRNIYLDYLIHQRNKLNTALDEAEREALLKNESMEPVVITQKTLTTLKKIIHYYNSNPAGLLKHSLDILKKKFEEFSKTHDICDPLLAILIDKLHLNSAAMDITYCGLPHEFKTNYKHYQRDHDAETRFRHLILLGYLLTLQNDLVHYQNHHQKNIDNEAKQQLEAFALLLKKYLHGVYYFHAHLTENNDIKEAALEAFTKFKSLHTRSFTISDNYITYQAAAMQLENIIKKDKEDYFHKVANRILNKIDFMIKVAIKPKYEYGIKTLNLIYDYLVTPDSDKDAKTNIVNELLTTAKHSPGSAKIGLQITGAVFAFIGGAIALASLLAIPTTFGLTSPISILGITIGATLFHQGMAIAGIAVGATVSYYGMRLFNATKQHHLAKNLDELVHQKKAEPDDDASFSRCRFT